MGRQIIIKGADFSANAYTNTEGYLAYQKMAEKSMAYTFIDENTGNQFGRTLSASSYITTMYGMDVSGYVGKTIHFSGPSLGKPSSSESHGGVTATTCFSLLFTTAELSSIEVSTTKHYYEALEVEWPELDETIRDFSLVVPSGAKTVLFNARTEITPILQIVHETNE